jgi:hypothetical protein
MGHSHAYDDMNFLIGHHEGQYINCGYPRKDKKYFEFTKETNKFESKSFLEFISPLKPVLRQVK